MQGKHENLLEPRTLNGKLHHAILLLLTGLPPSILASHSRKFSSGINFFLKDMSNQGTIILISPTTYSDFKKERWNSNKRHKDTLWPRAQPFVARPTNKYNFILCLPYFCFSHSYLVWTFFISIFLHLPNFVYYAIFFYVECLPHPNPSSPTPNPFLHLKPYTRLGARLLL